MSEVKRWIKTQIPSCNYNAPEYVLASDYDALKAENERLAAALREMMQWVDAALKAPHWHWDGDQREAAENEFACAKAALSAVPSDSPAKA